MEFTSKAMEKVEIEDIIDVRPQPAEQQIKSLGVRGTDHRGDPLQLAPVSLDSFQDRTAQLTDLTAFTQHSSADHSQQMFLSSVLFS